MQDTNTPEDSNSDPPKVPTSSAATQIARATLQVIGGAVPGIGGILSAAAAHWSEKEQEHINRVFEQWLQMLEEELREKAHTIVEIMARLDMNDQQIRDRIELPEYRALMKKAFRNWQNIDSEPKRQKVRNLLSNAAASTLASDDVIRLFLDWIDDYSDFHFSVIGEIYRNGPISRAAVWDNIGRGPVREDSAEADLFKLLIRDLSTGSVVRQQRETDGYGNFIKKETPHRSPRSVQVRSATVKSAFDHTEQYVLTDLGRQFVHYAMNELAPRITFQSSS